MAIEYKFDKDPKASFIGFEMVDSDMRASNEELYRNEFDPAHYPFYNIYKGDTSYLVKLNIAGYKQDELAVSVDKDIMTVTGKRVATKIDMELVFDGINEPDDFSRSFRLADNLTIDTISYHNGTMIIKLKINFVAEREGEYGSSFKTGDAPKKKVIEPVIVAPIVEPVVIAPVIEEPKVEIPVEVAPIAVVEEPKIEVTPAPVVEAPKVEEPKPVEIVGPAEVVVEAPKVEEPVAVVEVPVAVVEPVVEPVVETPVAVEEPKPVEIVGPAVIEEPKVEVPVAVVEPVVETPKVEEPKPVETPVVEVTPIVVEPEPIIVDDDKADKPTVEVTAIDPMPQIVSVETAVPSYTTSDVAVVLTDATLEVKDGVELISVPTKEGSSDVVVAVTPEVKAELVEAKVDIADVVSQAIEKADIAPELPPVVAEPVKDETVVVTVEETKKEIEVTVPETISQVMEVTVDVSNPTKPEVVLTDSSASIDPTAKIEAVVTPEGQSDAVITVAPDVAAVLEANKIDIVPLVEDALKKVDVDVSTVVETKVEPDAPSIVGPTEIAPN